MRMRFLVMSLALAACLPAYERTSRRDRGGDGGNPYPVDVPPGVTLDAATTSMVRLSPTQYRYTVRDLLALTDAQVANLKLPLDEGRMPSQLTVSKLGDFAAEIVALGAHRKLVPCDVNAAIDDACASKYIAAFGARAFRHPLNADETAALVAVYTKAKAQFTFAESIDVVTRVMLQAPQFVYVREEGEPVAGLPNGLVRVGSYEVASRLSYLLWDSMPDDALFAAAAEKKLDTAGLRAQTQRMLGDPRAKNKMIQFVSQWMELDGSPKHVSVEEAVKDPARYPADSAALRAAMRKEIQEFVGRIWDNGGSVNDLFTSNDAYVNGPLAQLYGVTGGPTGDTWAWVKLPADRRAGLATRAAFLLVYSNPDTPSPIRRGAAVWRDFMCTTFPPPPPEAMDVKINGGGTDATGKPRSIRDNVDLRTMSDPNCAGCHQKINPAGFALGHYDALGQWQDVEKGTAPDGKVYTSNIDATGELVGSDVPGVIDGAVAFSQKLATSRQLKDCVAQRVWRGSFGRDATPEEATSLHYVQEKLAASGSVRDAFVAIVESPAFQYMRSAQERKP